MNRIKQLYPLFKEFVEKKNLESKDVTQEEFSEVFKMKRCPMNENVRSFNQDIPLEQYKKKLGVIRDMIHFLYDIIFDVMLIERDVNTIDTPKRLAKLLVPDLSNHNELLSGRWCEKPSLTSFEYDEDADDVRTTAVGSDIIVKVKINLYSLCSHHMLPFGTFNSKPSVYVIYVANKIYPGLSKIGRLVNYIARRGWMQEKLAEAIAETIKKEFKLKGVFVLLDNIVHSCSIHRGYSDDTEMSTMYYNGVFKTDEKLLQTAKTLL
jgi:GTP cyclohydrolase I